MKAASVSNIRGVQYDLSRAAEGMPEKVRVEAMSEMADFATHDAKGRQAMWQDSGTRSVLLAGARCADAWFRQYHARAALFLYVALFPLRVAVQALPPDAAEASVAACAVVFAGAVACGVSAARCRLASSP